MSNKVTQEDVIREYHEVVKDLSDYHGIGYYDMVEKVREMWQNYIDSGNTGTFPIIGG